jgi:hypothetical protein
MNQRSTYVTNAGTYIASRASLPKRAATWRRLRDVDGWKITSSWIDEADVGQTPDLGALWVRIASEVAGSERLVLYVEPDDFPLKSALIEVGIAIANLIPIRIVAPGVVIDPVSYRPIGSWVRHPLVTFSNSVEEALDGTTVNM